MNTTEKLLMAIIALFVAMVAPGAVSSLDTATHRISSVVGLVSDPAQKSTSEDVSTNAPIAGKIRDVIDELLRE